MSKELQTQVDEDGVITEPVETATNAVAVQNSGGEITLSTGFFNVDSDRPQTLEYMFDCKKGAVKTLDKKTIFSDSMSFTLLFAAPLLQKKLFNYPAQDWVYVAGIDKDGFIFSTLFKKASISNLKACGQAAYRKGVKSIYGCVLTAKFVSKSTVIEGTKTDYFVVEFELESQDSPHLDIFEQEIQRIKNKDFSVFPRLRESANT